MTAQGAPQGPGFAIARELLTVEHEQLLRDHYDGNPDPICDGCARAYSVRLELDGLAELDGLLPELAELAGANREGS